MPHSPPPQLRSGPSSADARRRAAVAPTLDRVEQPRARRFLARCAFAALAGLSGFAAASCDDAAARASAAKATPASGTATTPDRVASAPVAPPERTVDAWRTDLLDLAYGAASALPTDPHVKTRCRLQEDCVRAALALGQPARALRYADGVVDWRRAASYAAYAVYAAENGAKDEALRAAEIADARLRDHAQSENAQDWQRDRVKALLATMRRRLGDLEEARRLGAALEPAEAAAWRAEEAAAAAAKEPARELDALAEALRVGGLDEARGALAAAVKVYEVAFADATVRARAVELVATGFAKLPPDLRAGYWIDLSGAAVRRGDRAAALGFVDRAKTVVGAERWLPGDHTRLFARLALARAAAGDLPRARDEAENGRAIFEAHRKKIPDFERAEALAPLAEAYFAAGDEAAARAHWKRAVEDAASNPNGRPRAEDFVGVVVALVGSGPAPDADLLASLKALRVGLAAPW